MLDDFQKAVEQRNWLLYRRYLQEILLSIEEQSVIEVTLIWVDTYMNILIKDSDDRIWIDSIYGDIRTSLISGVLCHPQPQLNRASGNRVINMVKNVLRNLWGLALVRSDTRRVEYASEVILFVIGARLLIQKYFLAPELAELHSATNKSPQARMNAQVGIAIKVANHPDILALEQRLWSNLIRLLSAYM